MIRKTLKASALGLAALWMVSCGQQVTKTQSGINYSNSSDAESASYVEENDLADVFANRDADEKVEVSGNEMQAASLKLTNGVSEAFAEAGVDAGDDQVGDIVNLLLSVFVALTSGDISSLMGVLNEVIGMVVDLIGGGDPQFALQESNNDVIGDVVSVLMESLAALMSGDMDAFVTIMIEFIANLIGGLS